MDPVPAAAEKRGFGWFFAANTAAGFGAAITGVALPVVAVQVLHADEFGLGIVRAAQFVPYAALGLFAGVLADRLPHRALLVVAALGRALALAAVPLLWWAGDLTVWTLTAALLVYGCFAVPGFAASQSVLPSLVPRSRLLHANARIDQGEATAAVVGPGLGGLLIGWLGSPIAMAVESVTRVVEAVLMLRLPPSRSPRAEALRAPHAASSPLATLRHEIAEGVRFTYRHHTLGALAISTHVWFIANSAALTVLSTVLLGALAMPASVYGLVMTLAAVAGLAGALLAVPIGRRLGAGWTITAARLSYPLAWAALAVLVTGASRWQAVVVGVTLALAALGFTGAVENTSEAAYRQVVTPQSVLGRTVAVMRAGNRTLAALGAVVGGAVAVSLGPVPTLWACVAIFAVALLVVVPRLPGQRIDEDEPSSGEG